MRSLILRGLVFALLVSGYTAGTTMAFAGPFEDAIAAYNRHEYGTALRLMRPLAEQGNADAQNGMGALYYISWLWCPSGFQRSAQMVSVSRDAT